MPEYSARIAGSFGLRASNRSATRGRPPVMSRVFELSCGSRASTSPIADPRTVLHAERSRRTAARTAAGMSVFGKLMVLALAVDELRTIGAVRRAIALRRVEIDDARWSRPVISSTWLVHGDAVDEVARSAR